jgi:hypothetical protein
MTGTSFIGSPGYLGGCISWDNMGFSDLRYLLLRLVTGLESTSYHQAFAHLMTSIFLSLQWPLSSDSEAHRAMFDLVCLVILAHLGNSLSTIIAITWADNLDCNQPDQHFLILTLAHLVAASRTSLVKIWPSTTSQYLVQPWPAASTRAIAGPPRGTDLRLVTDLPVHLVT